MQAKQAKALFTLAALFNFTAVIVLHPATGIAAALGLVPLIGTGAFEHIALLAIAFFGAGYSMVARSPDDHRGLVKVGLATKVGVVAIILGHFMAGSANIRMLLLVSGDLVFALAFLYFLVTRRSVAATGAALRSRQRR